MDSRQQQQPQERPKITDAQAIEMQFGGFRRWLNDNGLPTPSTAEFRMMLYSSLYVEFQNQIRKNQDQFLEQLRMQIPQVQQALQEYQERRTPVMNPDKMVMDPAVPGADETVKQVVSAPEVDPNVGQ